MKGIVVKQEISLKVNGKSYKTEVEPRQTLLQVLRDNLGLTGAKPGCEQGECCACTVLVDGQPVTSCLMLACQVQYKEIITIEGLAENGKLHPLQQSFIDHFAVQCGYCTPGMILTAKALLDTNLNPSEDDIRLALSGNICRCGGYLQIVEAIQAVATKANK